MLKKTKSDSDVLKYKESQELSSSQLFIGIVFVLSGFFVLYAGFSQEDKNTMVILLGGLFTVLSLFSIVPDVRISILDKTKNKFVLKRRGFFRKTIKRNLNEIIKANCAVGAGNRVHPGMSYTTFRVREYQVNVELLSSEYVSKYVHLTSKSNSDSDEKQEMALEINTFLNL